MTEDGTRTLTAAIASGDPDALAALYDTYFDLLYAEARRVTRRDENYCLDIVQDAMVKTIKRIPTLDTEPQLRRWLRLVIQSCAYDRLRADGRRRVRETTRVIEPPTDDDLNEHLDWLHGEIERMDHHSAQLLLLRHRSGWTLDRIGRALGLSTGAVDGRLRRIMDALSRKAARELMDES